MPGSASSKPSVTVFFQSDLDRSISAMISGTSKEMNWPDAIGGRSLQEYTEWLQQEWPDNLERSVRSPRPNADEVPIAVLGKAPTQRKPSGWKLKTESQAGGKMTEQEVAELVSKVDYVQDANLKGVDFEASDQVLERKKVKLLKYMREQEVESVEAST